MYLYIPHFWGKDPKRTEESIVKNREDYILTNGGYERKDGRTDILYVQLVVV